MANNNNHDRHNHPTNVLSVLCDASHVQTIAITCRCGKRWTERVPQEIHDSTMTVQFECVVCHTLYHLKNKQLNRVKEDAVDELNKAIQYTINSDRKYDA